MHANVSKWTIDVNSLIDNRGRRGLDVSSVFITQLTKLHSLTMAAPRLSLLLLALLSLAASTSADPTIYEIVSQFGFPPGILPDSVTSYTTAPDGDGFTFSVSLKKPCYVKFDYLVYFDSTITGKITYGKITNLKGLKAESFIFWLNIDDMTVNGNSISFTLGLVSVNLDIKQFETIPTCKDKALADCDQSSDRISKLPINAEEVDRVIME
ncbi:hypothetical protein L1987_67435 [Smallanthus sonchifolius]|uniref:Uncharacterized protein n=1 Tax=Smallanthus sonchifolius TaxID=185202 RepID=A0ACB9B3J0_9ASTR|nr:hypothetical protein L1987_67435 [Smallanthus sonchifolius]